MLKWISKIPRRIGIGLITTLNAIRLPLHERRRVLVGIDVCRLT